MKPDTPSRERAMGEVMVLVFQIHGTGRSGVGYHEVRAGTGPVAPKEKGTPHCHKRVALITDAPRRPPLSKLKLFPHVSRKKGGSRGAKCHGDQEVTSTADGNASQAMERENAHAACWEGRQTQSLYLRMPPTQRAIAFAHYSCPADPEASLAVGRRRCSRTVGCTSGGKICPRVPRACHGAAECTAVGWNACERPGTTISWGNARSTSRRRIQIDRARCSASMGRVGRALASVDADDGSGAP